MQVSTPEMFYWALRQHSITEVEVTVRDPHLRRSFKCLHVYTCIPLSVLIKENLFTGIRLR